MNTGLLIKQIRRQKSITREQLADLSGVSYHTIAKYEQGIGSRPMYDNIVKIAKVLDVDPTALMNGEEGAAEEKSEDVLFVPMFSQKVSAGGGQDYLTDEMRSERVPFIKRFARRYREENLYAAEVKGDSMTGVHLMDGDIVIFARGVIEGNGIYVITVDDEMFVKRVEFDPFEKKLSIISENPRYSTKTVTPDRVRVEGKVIGWVHSHPY